MYERVVVGTDGSDTADRAVEAGARLAVANDSELVVAHAFSARMSARQRAAWQDAPDEVRWRLSPGTIAEATVLAAVDRARDVAHGDLFVSSWTEPGHPVAVLLNVVERVDADVLVIGNRDMPGRARMRRSVGRAVARRATCDVVIVDTLGRRQQRQQRSPGRDVALLEARSAGAVTTSGWSASTAS